MHEFQVRLLHWYDVHKREHLPWRHTTDPYCILVSEIMLQQTQVNRVVPIYNAFVQRFPTLKDLAASELGPVLQAWKGLGYNRRAKFLWQAAQACPSGKLPETMEELQKLPGIGHYTAGAILAFSANRDVFAIDTNVKRIFHRQFRDTSAPFIASMVPLGAARDWHAALMDFGSLVCMKNPQCTECPVRATCKAYTEQDFRVPVQKQSTFLGSNRYYRGKILDALRVRAHTVTELEQLGPKEKIAVALAGLEKESIVQRAGNSVRI